MLSYYAMETFLTIRFHKILMNEKKKKGCPSNIPPPNGRGSVNVTRLGTLHVSGYCHPLEESADAASQFLKIKLLNNLRTFLEIIFKHSCVQDSESLL